MSAGLLSALAVLALGVCIALLWISSDVAPPRAEEACEEARDLWSDWRWE